MAVNGLYRRWCECMHDGTEIGADSHTAIEVLSLDCAKINVHKTE